MKKLFLFFVIFVLSAVVFYEVSKTTGLGKEETLKTDVYFGVASWYGPGFYGKKMANCKRYKPFLRHVAHKDLPLGTRVLITNLENGKQILVQVLDRGPYVKDRDFDLSRNAAKDLGAIKEGVIPISYKIIGRPSI